MLPTAEVESLRRSGHRRKAPSATTTSFPEAAWKARSSRIARWIPAFVHRQESLPCGRTAHNCGQRQNRPPPCLQDFSAFRNPLTTEVPPSRVRNQGERRFSGKTYAIASNQPISIYPTFNFVDVSRTSNGGFATGGRPFNVEGSRGFLSIAKQRVQCRRRCKLLAVSSSRSGAGRVLSGPNCSGPSQTCS